MAQKASKFLRVLMHGFFLTSLNLLSGAIAFLVLRAAGFEISYVSGAFIAIIFGLGVYALVFKLMKQIQPTIMQIDSLMMGTGILLLSIALQPGLIYPLISMVNGVADKPISLLSEITLPLGINAACLLMNFFILGKH